MRLMCINNKPLPGSFNENLDKIKEGDVYSGHISTAYNRLGIYTDAWFVNEVGVKFNLSRFIPLSGMDETKLVNTKEESHA